MNVKVSGLRGNPEAPPPRRERLVRACASAWATLDGPVSFKSLSGARRAACAPAAPSKEPGVAAIAQAVGFPAVRRARLSLFQRSPAWQRSAQAVGSQQSKR